MSTSISADVGDLPFFPIKTLCRAAQEAGALSEIASGVPEICDFKTWLSFFLFFPSSFRTLTKTAIKRERLIQLP